MKKKNSKKISPFKKTIWIDLENSPHVLFFNPIIKELREKGYEVIVTARDYAQVIGLADLFNLSYKRVGRHYGKNYFLKTVGLLIRATQMIPVILKNKPNLALSHGSRSQAIISKIMGLPVAMAFDYEYTQKLPFFRYDLIIVPEVLFKKDLNIKTKCIFGYPGTKENVYVQDLAPDGRIYEALGINKKNVIATIRPPATSAHYHNSKSDELFREVIEYLMSQPDCLAIILPRTKEQSSLIKDEWRDRFSEGRMLIPNQVVNGLNLIWHSDLVISGGGTLIREAAALGVPAYSTFGGQTGAIDEYLSENGRLTLIRGVEDVQGKILIEKRGLPNEPEHGNSITMQKIVDEVISFTDSCLSRSSKYA